ncbi:MAG: hypothetical protein BIFFINMI_00542 [Phycisphaerae bacterium]|nr:hypothetical protein [Phycisphaerae bacterium]
MTCPAILILLLCVLCSCSMAATPGVLIEDGQVRNAPVRGPAQSRQAAVVVPRAWMRAPEALTTAHRQAGLLYAVIPARFDAPVGPFRPGESVKVDALVERVAAATGTRIRWINDVVVFDPPAAEKQDGREDVSSLDARGDSDAAVPLTRLAGSDDGSTRLQALAALCRLEGEFIFRAWPGRVSIFEVLADRIDRKGLLFALEQGGPVGGRNWKLAVELLARAREPVLARQLWEHAWLDHSGTMELSLWGLGRCGDPCGRWAMRARVREVVTNEPSHRYLAAMAQGQLDAADRLTPDAGDKDVEVRRAVAFGLGFCRPDNESAQRCLMSQLADADPAVRFVACQSLARLGTETARAKLAALAADTQAASDLRVSALTALVEVSAGRAEEVVAKTAADADPAVRAAAAELLADVPGVRAEELLLRLADDKDAGVRCGAVCSLARLGSKAGIARAAKALDDAAANADLRIAAILGLGHSLSPLAADPLGKIAADVKAPERLRNYAVIGLARLADRAGQEKMIDLATPDSPRYLPLAVRHLALATPRETAEFLIPLLTHADRIGACNAAGRLGDLAYGPAIVELLEGSDVLDNHTRNEHMWGAVRSAGREATLALVQASADRRPSIRGAAASALGGRLWPEAVDALVRLGHDQDARVRMGAARSLGVTPDPLAAEALIEVATGDTNTAVAIEAVAALRRRDFREMPRVREALAKLAGSDRDAGGITEAPPVAAQPANSFVLRAWDDHAEENLVTNLTYESSLCYDAFNGRIVQWGAHGRRYDTPQTALTWFFDAESSRWTRLTDSVHWPNGVCGVRGTAYDDANRVVISPRSGGSCSHGWHNALRANLMHSSPWILDVTTDQWYPARALSYWAGGYMPASHDPRHGVTLWWRDRLIAFDVYANSWFEFRPKGPGPTPGLDTGGQFDRKTGLFITFDEKSTWAFDPTTHAWTDLRPRGDVPPPCPMVYDSANDVMLAFNASGGQVGVWVYHIRDNRWDRQPSVYPCPARGKVWDAAYDRANNVAVIGGTSPSGLSASLNARETWTYRYLPAQGGPAVAAGPADVACTTVAGGSVKITWSPPAAQPAKYRIERGAADHAWQVTWQKAGEVPGSQTTFTDMPGAKALTFYRVVALGEDGQAGVPSSAARTAPRIVCDLTAMVRPAGGVHLKWTTVGDDVVGCHVYRAPVELSPWTTRFNPEDVAKTLTRITDHPAADGEFVDASAEVAGPADELTWPRTYAYVVRPVNAWGVEGGPSPVTLALADPPGPVRTIPWADGRRLILWGTCRGGDATGYRAMRMDGWYKDYVFRLQAAPLAAPACWDDAEFPTTDRRRYYVSGLDATGAVGTPTSGDWTHGFP